MQVLSELSYLNAKKGSPYSYFSNWLEWAELQDVKCHYHTKIELSVQTKM